MELIVNSKKLTSEFARLLKEYKNYAWSVAWASSSSKFHPQLLENEDRISKITIGIHFYQTHPDFIKSVMNNNNVRFIKQPSGTFHPKLYLFYNDSKDWEILIGSSNFTNSAFTQNAEANILVSSKDENSGKAYEQSMKLIERSWEEGQQFTEEELNNYREMWKKFTPKIKSLSNDYGGGSKSQKPAFDIPIMNKTWEQFVKDIKAEELHSYKDRLRTLHLARSLFNEVHHFIDLSTEKRKFIAGMPNRLGINGSEHWGLFGSMQGAGTYKNRIIDNDENISKALDQIPLSGQIAKSHFNRFVTNYQNTFEGNYIATATRLLSMKRPDVFVCFDSQNRKALCSDFDITQSNMTYERYWDEIIERIYDCEWWQNPDPKNEVEQQISYGRAAFLDSLYYEG